VQANRTATVNANLKVGEVDTTITVQETPLINAVDTTNGYIPTGKQIEAVPLPTGSFTGLAILSPGVNAELPAGTGANAGLGISPSGPNGQRDTSNYIHAERCRRQQPVQRKEHQSGRFGSHRKQHRSRGRGSTTAQIIQSTASPYLAIGQAIRHQLPRQSRNFRVNTSMYDAQQGSTSGAHNRHE